MLKEIAIRIKQGHRTMKFPAGSPPALPERYRGLPLIKSDLCPPDCRDCIEACPTGAITQAEEGKTLDIGKCIFCSDCMTACNHNAINFSKEYRMAVSKREDLLMSEDQQVLNLAEGLNKQMKRVFGRSLKLRQVSAGGCNACEADINVLGTIGWDLGRFGIEFVPSPRHADGLLITGPITKNMVLALQKAYVAIPDPKFVIAVGTCALSGGLYLGHDAVENGVESLFPVDLFIPGCPPNPLTTLDGLLRLIGKIKPE
jgi:Ni,Fe-hydrogenase III small subunit/NAD-dependent dihydropyrimidine dehydrogenase PreA subunit